MRAKPTKATNSPRRCFGRLRSMVKLGQRNRRLDQLLFAGIGCIISFSAALLCSTEAGTLLLLEEVVERVLSLIFLSKTLESLLTIFFRSYF